MKVRDGFVSNSSASSFIINIERLNMETYNALLNPIDYFETYVVEKWKKYFQDDYDIDEYVKKKYDELGISYVTSSPWTHEINNNQVVFYTDMDNFDLIEFAIWIGIDKEFIDES